MQIAPVPQPCPEMAPQTPLATGGAGDAAAALLAALQATETRHSVAAPSSLLAQLSQPAGTLPPAAPQQAAAPSLLAVLSPQGHAAAPGRASRLAPLPPLDLSRVPNALGLAGGPALPGPEGEGSHGGRAAPPLGWLQPLPALPPAGEAAGRSEAAAPAETPVSVPAAAEPLPPPMPLSELLRRVAPPAAAPAPAVSPPPAAEVLRGLRLFGRS